MKFRDPKTGRVFESIRAAWRAFCCGGVICYECGLRDRVGSVVCFEWADDHPAEAARLMGYEIIEEEAMEETKKPRICEALGVRAGELFYIEDFPDVRFWIMSDGTFRTIPSRVPGSSKAMLLAIENPDLVIHKPRWTETDIEDAKAIIRSTGMKWVARDKNGRAWAYVGDPTWNGEVFFCKGNGDIFCASVLCDSILPSLRPGEKVRLSDIIGGEP